MNRRTGAWLIIIVGMIICRGMYLDNVFYNIDEAEYAVAADVMKQGGLPGVDLLGSTKPPGIAILYLGLFEVFGRSLTVIHVASLVLMILMGWIVIETANRLWGEKALLPAALLFLMTANSFSLPSEMIALNVEIPGMVLASAAILIGLRARRGYEWILAGFLLGLSILFRQSLAVFLLPIGAIIWFQKGLRLRSSLSLLAGVAVPLFVVLGIYAARDGLGWAFDSWVRYPALYASDLGVAGFFTAMLMNMWEYVQQCFVPLGLAAFGKLVLLKTETKSQAVFLLTLAFASFLALASGSRFFGHYFVQIIPAIALLGVPAWLWLQAKERWGTRIIIGTVLVGSLMTLTHFPLWKYWDSAATRSGVPEASLTPSRLEYQIADFIKENTDPSDKIAVWGYCPQIYFLSERLPAVRDYLCHYVTGFSTGSFDPHKSEPPRTHGHPDAEQMFIDDLRRSDPKYLISTSLVYDYEYTFNQLPFYCNSSLNEYIKSEYSRHGIFQYADRSKINPASPVITGTEVVSPVHIDILPRLQSVLILQLGKDSTQTKIRRLN